MPSLFARMSWNVLLSTYSNTSYPVRGANFTVK